MDKMDNCFGDMTLSYELKSGDDYEFDQPQKLTKGIDINLKRQCDGVPENYVVIFFSLSALYPTLDCMVTGFDIEKLFTKAQSAAATAPLTTGNNASFASFSTAMTNIRNKNAARLTDNDKDETIDYKDMPKDVREICQLKNNLVKIIA